MTPGARERGFTLLELLVAAALLTLIAVFSWRGLDALVREREAIASSQDAIDATSRAFARLERDALLARDAELDDDGRLRLAASTAPEADAATGVAYRLVGGALVRSVDDGSAPLALVDGLAAATFDVWVAGQAAGWSRTKSFVAEQPAPPTAAGGARATTQPGAAAATSAGTSAGTSATAAASAGNVAATPPGGRAGALPPLQPGIATGLRVVLARADGTTLVRVFLIGSGG